MYSFSSLDIATPTVYSTASSPNIPLHELDAETLELVVKANGHLSEYIHVLANEPSIGLFHIQEHIRKAIPKLVSTKKEFKSRTQVKSLHGLNTFSNIKSMLEDAKALGEDHLIKEGKLPPRQTSSSSFRSFSELPKVTKSPNSSTKSLPINSDLTSFDDELAKLSNIAPPPIPQTRARAPSVDFKPKTFNE